MAKILLLNPPGTRPYLRDYYCSKVAKANYLYEPTDLLMLSGLLAEHHEVDVLDCIALGLRVSPALQRIQAVKPDVVVFLSGAVSWREDREFLKEVKRASGAVLIGSGDLFLDDSVAILNENNFIDATLLDFTTSDLLLYLKEGEGAEPENMVYRGVERIVQGPLKRARNGTFEIPVPRHDLFPHRRYHYPTVKHHPFATVLTDYGCPYHCHFCVMGELGYKVRPVDNVLAELEVLAAQGFREIYFNDQTFGVSRGRTLEMCQRMLSKDYHFGWQAWARVDLVDKEMLKSMRAAGCHTLLFGVESGNEGTLQGQKKGYCLEQIRTTFARCRQLRIRTLATFIIGLPGENEADIRRTIDFALELDPDLASFNVLVPRAGTKVREDAVKKGWLQPGYISLDQSGTYPVMGNEYLSAKRVWRLKNEAIRTFYARPNYWRRRLRNMTTFYELRRNLVNGWALLQQTVTMQASRLRGKAAGEDWS